MTPHVASSLVADLVEMAKATERLPEVEAENERLQRQHVADGDHIATLEIRLSQRASEIEELNSRIRSLEVERDDYGFRALAADDKANAFAVALRNAQALVEAALEAAEPEPVPMPEPTVEPKPETSVDVSSAIPSGDIAPPPAEIEAIPMPDWAKPEGQSDVNPTVVLEPIQSSIASSPIVGEKADVLPVLSAPNGPYHGKLYMREPGYINRYDWLNGGGSEEAYDWRPGNPLPAGYTDYAQVRSA